MPDEYVDEELSQMYEEGEAKKVLDSSTFQKPIKQLKVRKPVVLSPSQTVGEAVKLMRNKRFGCVVVAEKEKLIGILTERDILMKVAIEKGAEVKTVREVMTPNPEVFEPEDSIAFVLNAMHVGGYRHVPVVDEKNKPLAVVSVKDIVGFILDHFPEDVLNLPPKPVRSTDQREGA
ncbi:MAG: CBS domain-containing protein [Ignavibacteriales bacterium]|nr:CBS domain-containing protein [Ignavibacteriales bacterium]